MEKLQKFLLLSRFFLSSYYSSSPSSSFAGNFCTSSFLLALRCVFLSFSLVFHALMKDCCCQLLKAVRMLFCHESMFIWCGKSRVCSCLEVYVKELNSAENRTHRTCMSSEFFGFNTYVFPFLWYFKWIIDFIMRILEFESPHFVEYKNRYDFLKFAVLLKPLFSIGAGIGSKLQNFVLDA